MNNSNAKRRSLMKIGLVVRLAELPETGKAPSYAEIRQTALKAEKGGFDSIWLYDHLLYRNEEKTTGIWECWTMMSALAEATSQVEIGSLVLCNSFRNPAILAKMAATLDEVSGGCAALSLALGPLRSAISRANGLRLMRFGFSSMFSEFPPNRPAMPAAGNGGNTDRPATRRWWR
jgi:alkanesulfonate monooxygenase SsuD/methylene tetrahydromethanopterin reductase-like flavin-dependent oxidoreductase (luciferase family)